MRPFLLLASALPLAAALAGCGTAAYDPGPEPDARTIVTPQLAILFPGAPPAGVIEITPVRRGHPLAPAPWMACLRMSDKGQRRHYALFFKEKLLVHLRAALPVDECERDRYDLLERKKAGP